jgi:uncharacterized cupin superfamily protein
VLGFPAMRRSAIPAIKSRSCNNRALIPEAPLTPAGAGLSPDGDGWFIVNARDARWQEGDFGAFTAFEGAVRFPQLGINIGVLEPGQPACMYHGENEQEDFLVLSGECLLLIEGEERSLKAWDFVHCPAWTEHVFVGAGSGPCAILAVGSRTGGDVIYPASDPAQRNGAGVDVETADPNEAYARFRPNADVEYREGWLPS